jgi:hypothetical protein
LAALGLNVSQVETIIMGLSTMDYHRGPETDRAFVGHNVWVFKYRYNGQEIYIKLSDNFDCNIAKCISFHL